MEFVFGDSLSASGMVFLIAALLLALSFEFVNGFHDTANAVATVIYTHALKPAVAVVWSGIWNLIGVLTSSGAVAFGVLALLPVELVLNVSSGAGYSMVFALLLAAITWNLGTWYLGLPASSSHTLIGAIMGVGLANSAFTAGHTFGEGVNWAKASEVGISLLISPIVGFCAAGLLMLLAKALIRRADLFSPPEKDKPPPLWIRALLIVTCTGVSFAHGSNDGQKGMGLILLILVGIIPAAYAVDLAAHPATLTELVESSTRVAKALESHGAGGSDTRPEIVLSDFLKTTGEVSPAVFAALAAKNHQIAAAISGKSSLRELSPPLRAGLRSDIYLAAESIVKLDQARQFPEAKERELMQTHIERLRTITRFIPVWVKVAVALALGLGTMIGWKRIVVTVGEKIGKEHLTYAQGASAELVAMTTIGLADIYGLPVSTTHVLSSGVAGTMAANRSGLQTETVRNLLLAWVLTLPVCVFLGAAFFAAGFLLLFRAVGIP